LGAARPVEASRPAERGRRGVDMLLGMVALARGDLVAAHDHLVVALRSRLSHGFSGRACDTISAIAVRCALGGDHVTAARLFGAAQATRSALRAAPGVYGEFWAAQQARVREEIGDAAFDEAYGTGALQSLPEAAATALAVEHPDLAAGSPRFLARPWRGTEAPAPTQPVRSTPSTPDTFADRR
ncbi:MAG TPA: adenylate/guanylate cyclase domain-containing protein, partial [Micromonosporaceae bacterium]|nr:adenylate/guanylate cyclase domain-containing protein [Micromonosporaceae bacterium]